jgi:acyl transferase domain-containing protein
MPEQTGSDSRERWMSNRSESTPIAIVGLSGIFPGAPDPDRFWQNIVDKIEGFV